MSLNLQAFSLNLSEQEYRNLPCLSYSAISKYDRVGYQSVLSLFEPVSTPALLFGSMVDCILTQGEDEFKKRYCICTVEEPSDALKAIYEYLNLNTKAEKFSEVNDADILQATEDTGYNLKWKPETRITKIKEGLSDYFDFKKLNKDKIVVSLNDWEDAFRAANALKENQYTGHFFDSKKHRDGWSYYTQLQFTSEEPETEIKYKGMLDLVAIDEVNKIIYPCDLKTTKEVYDFEESFYKYRYYLQASMYTALIRDVLKKNGIINYRVATYQFIVIDRVNFFPVIFEWKTTDDVMDCYRKVRKTWKELLYELDWTLKNKDLQIPYDWVYRYKDGIMPLSNYYI